MRSPRWVAFFLLLLARAPAWADPSPGTITVDIANLRTEQGWEICALYSSADGFPIDLEKAMQHIRVPIHDGQAVCEFPAVKPGAYAVSAMRDEKGTGIPAKDVFDMPKSGVGASNDARGFFGPPKFDDARFQYKGGALRIAIRMTYQSSK